MASSEAEIQSRTDGWGETTSSKAISPWAVVAIGCAIPSPLALLFSVFWLFPVISIIAGAIALRQSLGEDAQFAGVKIAMLGIVVSAALISWAFSKRQAYENHMYGVSEANFRHWMQLIKENNLREAHQLSQTIIQRGKEPVTLHEYYENDRAHRLELNSFFEEEPLKTIIATTDHWTLDGLKNVSNEIIFQEDRGTTRVFQVYQLDIQDGDSVKSLILRVQSHRMNDPQGFSGHWTVYSVRLNNA